MGRYYGGICGAEGDLYSGYYLRGLGEEEKVVMRRGGRCTVVVHVERMSTEQDTGGTDRVGSRQQARCSRGSLVIVDSRYNV